MLTGTSFFFLNPEVKFMYVVLTMYILSELKEKKSWEKKIV
jgi:hypothetical protein